MTATSENVLAPEPTPPLGERLRRLPWWWKAWWGAGLLLLLATVLFNALPTDCLGVVCTVFFVLWCVPTVPYLMVWLWLKITYRIGVRLFVSYVLIGVLPFPMILLLLGLGAYVLLGQYTAEDFGGVATRVEEELVHLAEESVAAAEAGGTSAAVAVLEGGPRLRQDLAGLGERVTWIFARGEKVHRSPGEKELALPGRESDVTEYGAYSFPDELGWGAVVRRGAYLAAVFLPTDAGTARVLNDSLWYAVGFLDEDVTVGDGNISIHGGVDSDDGDEAQEPSVDEPGEEAAAMEERPEGFLQDLWRNRWVVFIHVSPELRRWRDGGTLIDASLGTVLRTSPREAMGDLFRSPYELGNEIWGVFLGISVMILFAYLVVVCLALLQIFSITRAAARLSRGAREVQAGQLEYRIPVRRRDQLGDLAVTFNRMTASVEGMLEEVAEKERLKGELELAREIQQSLLPARLLRHGLLSVRAYFQPAAEVGGDYFDLFPLEKGRLIVAVGDVAGHGLSTGLLMAMVKSAVATLIHEGHRGAELLERLNRFMLEQPREHRMVTLTIADIDTDAGVVEITNAAHPPVLLAGGDVREVLLPALPVGFPWRGKPPSERLEIEPGNRLIFYSDGLVEAVDEDDEPFGYERLRTFFEGNAGLGSEELMAALLAELERHTGGRPLDDDLTVLIIDFAAEGEEGSSDEEEARAEDVGNPSP